MITLITIDLGFILWQLNAYFEGYIEGYLYYFATRTGKEFKNLHPIFTVVRAIVGLCAIMASLSVGDYLFNWKVILLLSLSFVGTFSYWHNGKYYVTRHKLDTTKYALGWKDKSTTSRATWDLSWSVRLYAFFAGLLFHLAAVMYIIIHSNL